MTTKTLKTPVTSILCCLAAAVLLFPFAGCEVKKTQDAKAPDVDVSVKGGQPPKYDVDTADVSVHKEEKEVTVPKITTEKEKVSVPNVDVNMPGNSDAESVSTATSSFLRIARRALRWSRDSARDLF